MSFFDAFTGKSQSRDLAAANDRAQAALAASNAEAKGYRTDYLSQARGELQPYADQGRQGFGLYADSLGVNGAQGGQRAQTAYEGARNPFLEYEQNRAAQASDRRSNAMGMVRGGAGLQAATRARMNLGYQDRNQWQNALAGFGQQGLQTAGQMSQMTYDTGNRLADDRLGYGTQLAGNAINYGNALAASRSTGWNNLFKIGEIGGKIAAAAASGGTAGSDIRVKRDIARIGTLPSGLPVYSFKYLWSDETNVGVMAQEAVRVFPDAVLMHPSGFLMVDYSLIG